MRAEKNRQQRKARYIKLRNKMREWPECHYVDVLRGTEFYCDHLFDPQWPTISVDFSFYHRAQRRYFAATLATLECEACILSEDAAWQGVQEPETDDGWGPIITEFRTRWAKLAEHNYPVQEYTEIRDYGPVVVRIIATVNSPVIDTDTIHEFIQRFHALGEPTTPGRINHGPEIQVSPARLVPDATQR